jgi:transposase
MPEKARLLNYQIKTMFCFFDIRGYLYPKGPLLIRHSTWRCIDVMRPKQGELWRGHSSILHHDKAPAHPSLRVSQFLAGKGISAMGHPPYSPDLAPADFWLFPKLKSMLKGKRILGIEDIKLPVKKIERHSCSGF